MKSEKLVMFTGDRDDSAGDMTSSSDETNNGDIEDIGSLSVVNSLNDDDSDELYAVEKLVTRRKFNGRFYYYVKWIGYDWKENTWEPVENLSLCPDLLRKLEDRLRKKKKKSSHSGRSTVNRKINKSISKASNKQATRNQNRLAKQVPFPLEAETKATMKVAIIKPRNGKGKELPDSHNIMNASMNGSEMSNCSYKSLEEKLGFLANCPIYRRSWRETETPLCVLGSCTYKGYLIYLVRLRPANVNQLTAAEINAYKDANDENCVVIGSMELREKFPDLIIKFYEKYITFEESNKTS